MNLDKITRQGRLSRREFLELATRAAGIASISSIPIINSACKGGPTTPDPPEPPIPVTLQFDVYNHTQGYRTSFTRNTTSGQNVNIKISECGANNVDPMRIAVREKNMGKLANFSASGEANFTAPNTSKSYDIFLMNKSYGTDYALMDYNRHGTTKLVKPRFATWYFVERDGKTGPVEAIEEVVAQFNNALNLGWMKYGSLTRVNSGGDIALGYALCLLNGEPVGGYHATNGDFAYVNPDVCRELGRDIRGVFIEEIFELLTFAVDIHGAGSLVRDQDRYLSIEGQELLRYVFAKDEKTS